MDGDAWLCAIIERPARLRSRRSAPHVVDGVPLPLVASFEGGYSEGVQDCDPVVLAEVVDRTDCLGVRGASSVGKHLTLALCLVLAVLGGSHLRELFRRIAIGDLPLGHALREVAFLRLLRCEALVCLSELHGLVEEICGLGGIF